MTIAEKLQRAANYLSLAPGIRQMDEKEKYRQFLKNNQGNLFFGVFDSLQSASDGIPRDIQTGYDNLASANIPYTSSINTQDYPAMFWLLRSLNEGMRSIFDLGGHTGVKYYAFRRTMNFPESLQWTVCDVPAVVERGRQIAIDRAPEGNLGFTDQYNQCSHQDILFASGSLQYLPLPLSEFLKSLHQMPRRIVVNTTPIHDTHAFFTLNSIGTAICPYRIQARQEFTASILQLGYRKVDEWLNIGKGLEIPGHSGHNVPAYSGFCFDLAR